MTSVKIRLYIKLLLVLDFVDINEAGGLQRLTHRHPKLTTRSIYYLVREFNGEKSLKLN